MQPRLILGSTSIYRAQLLKRLGLEFAQVAPDVDERGIDLPPHDLALELAKRKAMDVYSKHPGAVVIGSDQVPALGNEVLTKPGTTPRAISQLERLSGQTHTLITSVCVMSEHGCQTHTDVHRLTLRSLTRQEIEHYVARDAPLDCAGAYKIEALGIALMDRIDGDDFTAITGLPLIETSKMLRQAGVSIL